MPTRADGSLPVGRSTAPLSERQVQLVGSAFVGFDRAVPFRYDPVGRTRFVVENDENGQEVGIVYFGKDVFPGPGVADPNAALSMPAAVAHDISLYHRWNDSTELPLGVLEHLDEAQTSLDAALRFSRELSSHDVQNLIRDAVQRLQMLRAELGQ
jgi:hypothetical protein